MRKAKEPNNQGMSDLKAPDQDAVQDAAAGTSGDAAAEDGEHSYTESHARSFLKAMSWRATAFTVTGIIYFIWNGNWEGAGLFALADSGVKIVLYYFHERAWNQSRLGRSVTTGKTAFLAWARRIWNRPGVEHIDS